LFDFRADIAILLNITPDHLDRYDYQFEKYTASKFRIIRNQKADDSFIFCYDDEVIRKEISQRRIVAKPFPFSIHEALNGDGGWLEHPLPPTGYHPSDEKNSLVIEIHKEQFKMTLESLALQGRHNIYNSLAAGIAARVLDLRKSVVKESLSDFQNVEHRLEFVARVHGIDFINDSKATNVNSTWYALESIDKPVIWIAGGIDKGNDYSMLHDLVGQKVKAIVCLGVSNERIKEAFQGIIGTIVETRTAFEAVEIAYRLGRTGDVVLLSPACASFDLFNNYEDRGRQFKEAVMRI
jgi:UDP-N-acetylmuramoylalanine--D-glutamate ligase